MEGIEDNVQDVETQNNEFDATQFMLDDRNEEIANEQAEETEEQTIEDTQEDEQVDEQTEDTSSETETETVEATEETEQPIAEDTTEESTFSWDESEETSEETTEATNDEQPIASGDAWKEFAEELGINVDNVDDFKTVLKQQKELAQKSVSNQTINNLEGFLGLDDEALMREELKAQQYSAEEIDDEIDMMIENGTIKSAARKVRKDVESVIEGERQKLAEGIDTVNDAKQREIEEQEQALSEELKEYMSKTNTMFGGRINATQKQEHLEYIDSGTFFDDITENPKAMAEAAWLWKHKDRIMKGFQSKGVERGKQAILDDLKNPEKSRTNRIPDPETGDFNASRFLDLGEKM